MGGFSMDLPEGTLLYWREAELKHARVAMLATLGIFVESVFHPFFGGADPDYAGWLAAHRSPVMAEKFWPGLFLTCGLLETVSGGPWELDKPGARAPGDFDFDPLGL